MKLNDYRQFVDSITSKESKSYPVFLHRLEELEVSETNNINIPRLITAAFGLVSEGGEFTEQVKKLLFQGKPLNDELRTRLIKELGDVAWYWANACTALNVDPNEVLQINADKLKARFPEGHFTAERSENRLDGDI
ncbi:MAG: pyrophosphatase [Methanobacteriota archaeon]|jgi:NTP pyrophosphatase (non-canonical NTP hydrolase)|nr:MAG: pyrophosphatase [Euryarchaeota archaeon]